MLGMTVTDTQCAANTPLSLENFSKLLDTKLRPIKQRVDSLDGHVGSLLEHQARAEADKLFSGGYAKAMLAQSLQDLALLLPAEAVYSSQNRKEVSGFHKEVLGLINWQPLVVVGSVGNQGLPLAGVTVAFGACEIGQPRACAAEDST